MKLILEEEEEIEGEKSWKKTKEVKDKAEALTLKVPPKKFRLHKCYHDETSFKSCSVEEI